MSGKEAAMIVKIPGKSDIYPLLGRQDSAHLLYEERFPGRFDETLEVASTAPTLEASLGSTEQKLRLKRDVVTTPSHLFAFIKFQHKLRPPIQ